MEIKNEVLKNLLTKIDEENLSLTDIEEFTGNLDLDGLKEMFSLIEEEKISLLPLKIYITGYDKDLVKELEKSYESEGYIDCFFAGMWASEAIMSTTQDLIEAMLCFSLIGSDLTQRIRNGLHLIGEDQNVIDEFEEQIKFLVLQLSNEIEKDNFFNTITQSPGLYSDNNIFNNEDMKEELSSIIEIKNRVATADRIFELEKDNKKEELKKIKINKEKYTFLPESILNMVSEKEISDQEILSNINNELKTDIFADDFHLNDEPQAINENHYNNLEIMRDIESPSLIEKMVELFKKKEQKTKNGKSKGKVSIKQITTKSSRKNNFSSFKITLSLLILIIVLCSSFVALNQKEKVNDGLQTAERIAQGTLTNDKDKIEIIREGTNKDQK